jgi:siderophore synthetase component
VNVAELPTFALKLAVGVKISSSLRTISHFTADFGPRFSRDIVPRLAIDRDILAVELEPHSAVHRHKNPEVQKHFTVVLRQEYKPAADETIIVCAALLECGHSNTAPGVSAVEHIFGLDTESKRIQFLDRCGTLQVSVFEWMLIRRFPRYIELSAKALVPTLVSNGVAFEAHAQNLLVRVNKYTGTLLGFVIRDLGGLRIHPATLRQSTGVDFQFLPEHVVAAGTLEEVYPKFYHTYVHNHISRLVRLLGLHANGIGWDILRKHMSTVVPTAHPLWKLWLSPESKLVESKCLMRMRMQDSYRNVSPVNGCCIVKTRLQTLFIERLQPLSQHVSIPPRNHRWKETCISVVTILVALSVKI